MSDNLQKKIYSEFHLNFFDKLINKKRLEIINFINNLTYNKNLDDVLDIGTTNDEKNRSSNIIIKNLKGFNIFKSISNQDIKLRLFSKCLNKSISENFTEDEIQTFSSDLVISNATIEHVGSYENQLKMMQNIIKLSKKYFVIITPNRFHPIEFHTKLPFIHWLPKKIHRFILSMLGQKFLSLEENLNLLSKNDFHLSMEKLKFKNYQVKNIKFLFFNSNIILVGNKN